MDDASKENFIFKLILKIIGPAITAIGMMGGAIFFIASMDNRIAQTDEKIDSLKEQVQMFVATQNSINNWFISANKGLAEDSRYMNQRIDGCACKAHDK